MKSLILRFLKNESGATAIEYGLIAAIVGVGTILALSSMRTGMNNTFNAVTNAMQ